MYNFKTLIIVQKTIGANVGVICIHFHGFSEFKKKSYSVHFELQFSAPEKGPL